MRPLRIGRFPGLSRLTSLRSGRRASRHAGSHQGRTRFSIRATRGERPLHRPSRADIVLRRRSPSPRGHCYPSTPDNPPWWRDVPLVRSRSSASPPSPWGRPTSGQTSIEPKATLLSGHARRSRSATATQRGKVRPTVDIRNRVSRRLPHAVDGEFGILGGRSLSSKNSSHSVTKSMNRNRHGDIVELVTRQSG